MKANGEKIAYELKVTVDGTKKVILDEANNAINIFKDDSTIQICGMATKQEIPYKGWQTDKTENPRVYVKVPMTYNELSVPSKTIIDFTFTSENPKIPKYKKHWFSNLAVATSCSEKIDGIPRNSDIIIGLDYNGVDRDVEYEIKTPLTQKNYYIHEKLQSSKYPVSNDKGNRIIAYAYAVSYGGSESNFIEDSSLDLFNQNQDISGYSRSVTQSSQASERDYECRDNCD